MSSQEPDGERPVIFDIITPVDQDGLRRNIDHALSLGLPEADQAPLPILKIIANGPSAARAPLLCGQTMALNGALKLFTDKGLAPTYWAGCDPQPIVADFLTDAPEGVIYYVASKCHPSVFEALSGRDVRLWHIDDVDIPAGLRAIPSATSITLTAMRLMHRLGWRSFETWGWDGCYLDGKDHAVEQPHSGDVVSVDVNGKIFSTTGSWGAEAEDAWHQLSGADYDVTIHGGGFIGAALTAMNIPQAHLPNPIMRAA